VLYLALLAIIFAVNLLPAFGPPTWAILVFARLHWHLNPVVIVIEGALASSGGRYLLSLGARLFKDRLKGRLKTNLAAAQERLRGRKRIIGVVALFLVSPLPSAQLFVAAGLLGLPLQVLVVAFFFGRLVTYSLYVGAATYASNQFGSVLDKSFGSVWSIIIQVALVVAVCALPFVNWTRVAHKENP